MTQTTCPSQVDDSRENVNGGAEKEDLRKQLLEMIRRNESVRSEHPR